MEKRKKNKELGITLIILVITIIVLLILAGISIQMITGDNGIINTTVNAKEEKEKEEIRSQIEVEVLKSLDNYGKINLQTLKTKLEAINADTNGIEDIMEGNAKTGKISLKGYDFYVDDNNYIMDYSGPVITDIPKQGKKEAFDRKNGRVDIVFLNGTGYSITETPNKPALDNTMVPVYYDEKNSVWKVCSDTDTTNWYKYEAEDVGNAGSAAGDTHKNRWANVMLTDFIEVEKDGTTYTTDQIKTLLTKNNLSQIVGGTVVTEGSMLVWIPRYAYKITYYSDTEKTKIIGYSDSRGFVDTDGKTPSDMETPTTSVNVKGKLGKTTYEYYRPHPAFEKDLNQGGWETRITGIWVGKFETTGNEEAITAKSNTAALRYVRIGFFWDYIKNRFKAQTTGSHMMKNSEWGAIAYLAESKFGRNEVTITKNNSSDYYTGDGNYKNNQDKTTTGNIYGIYDTVGGLYEYVASYIPNEKNGSGYQFASIDPNNSTLNDKKISTQYATVYNYDSNSDTGKGDYKVNINKIFGDAIFETSLTGSGITSWHSQYSYFMSDTAPFLGRGGDYASTKPGLFCSSNIDGGVANVCGSRVICVIK